MLLFFAFNLQGVVLLQGFEVYGQDSQLFDHNWYLEKVVESGNDHFPPSNSEVSYVDMIFFNDNSGNDFETNVCNTFFGDLAYTGTNSFSITFSATTLIECNMQDNGDFEGVYFNSIFMDHIGEPFDYTITSAGNNTKMLVITNSSGDEAIYGSEQLSTGKFDNPVFTFYPNPVKDELFIESKGHDFSEVKITLYNLTGQQIKSANLLYSGSQISIPVKELNRGVYFVSLENESGSLQHFKIVKN